MWKEAFLAKFERLSRNLTGGTRNYEKPQRRQPISGRTFELVTSSVLHILPNDLPL